MQVVDQIARDLARQLGEPVLGMRPIPEGHSGFTYFVDLPGRTAVMRLPPPGTRIAGSADIPRQGRIQAALHRAGLPVPAIIAMSDRPVVDGRPFYLQEKVAGVRIDVATERVEHRRLAASAVEVLRRLHALPVAESGIGGEAPMPPLGEVERWTWLMDRAPQELTGSAPVLAARLRATAPPERAPVLVHGDYQYGNMLFEGERVVALLDWEIAQLGQGLLDLGCLVMVAQLADDGLPGSGVLDIREQDLLAAYGADPDEFRWYLALTYYKYASIFGYNLMLHRRGKRPDPVYETRTETIVGFIERGLAQLGEENE